VSGTPVKPVAELTKYYGPVVGVRLLSKPVPRHIVAAAFGFNEKGVGQLAEVVYQRVDEFLLALGFPERFVAARELISDELDRAVRSMVDFPPWRHRERPAAITRHLAGIRRSFRCAASIHADESPLAVSLASIATNRRGVSSKRSTRCRSAAISDKSLMGGTSGAEAWEPSDNFFDLLTYLDLVADCADAPSSILGSILGQIA
jgi:hypothetical protein